MFYDKSYKPSYGIGYITLSGDCHRFSVTRTDTTIKLYSWKYQNGSSWYDTATPNEVVYYLNA